ncbi:holo-ACP synthase [Kyrpidia tusciae]|uniref:Holo-[acyl-carrier-protein] synthase n=1 Tax=Kyrpidia tusciae (strain DSM 2912 / NBRC 15312 / T2) TaxID=562970 RepID=D5WSA2_KYRT2|nr:holo-ACP synthase [Kyrpidia tusciae]ADG04987.1 holo-acyl-carrier-protein synthase [Kyrpidia tusciae DSM 2912]MBE3552594.1 holo-ACP synthase [Kyrpidia tusciae]
MIVAVGVDVVEMGRIRESLRRRGNRLAERILGAAEKKQYAARRDPVAFLAGRFAAKEAVAKALGTGIGKVGFQEIEIAGGRGAPEVRLSGKAAEVAGERGIVKWHLSLSHGRETAVAFVVAEGVGHREAD